MAEDIDDVLCLHCGTSKPIKSILLHVVRSKKCKKYYETHNELDKLRERCHTANRAKKNNKRRLNYDPVAESERNKKNYEENRDQRITNKRARRNDVLEQMNPHAFDPKNKIFENFFKECQLGPIFPCLCCKRCLPLRGVQTFQQKFHETLIANQMDQYVDMQDFLKVNGKLYICFACHRNLSKKKMPNLCSRNGLELTPVPECLQISDVGNQLLAKHLIFIKFRRLPKTRMKSMNDRVSSIPLKSDIFLQFCNDIFKFAGH